jgi:hypothetical protein
MRFVLDGLSSLPFSILTYMSVAALQESSDLAGALATLASRCASVVVFRCSPGQKSAVVSTMQQRRSMVALAIGDGANDIGMLRAARVGVGVYGREGHQAVRDLRALLALRAACFACCPFVDERHQLAARRLALATQQSALCHRSPIRRLVRPTTLLAACLRCRGCCLCTGTGRTSASPISPSICSTRTQCLCGCSSFSSPCAASAHRPCSTTCACHCLGADCCLRMLSLLNNRLVVFLPLARNRRALIAQVPDPLQPCVHQCAVHCQGCPGPALLRRGALTCIATRLCAVTHVCPCTHTTRCSYVCMQRHAIHSDSNLEF